jgi:hypothetical protein
VDTPCAFVQTPARATGNPNCPDGIYSGDIALGPIEIQRLAGCTRITGNVSYNISTLTSFRGLESLRAIDGSFAPTTDCAGFGCVPTVRLADVSALAPLQCVGGEVAVLPQLAAGGSKALSSLSVVGGSLRFAPSTLPYTSLRFPALKRVWGDLRVMDPALVSTVEAVYGSLQVYFRELLPGELPRLTYIGCGSSYEPCRDGVLGCHFVAGNQSELNRLSACKVGVQSLEVSGSGVTDAAPLAALRSLRGTLMIQGTGLENLTPLRDLTRVSSLRITDNPRLQDVSGLGRIELSNASPVSIEVTNNPALVSLESWSALRIGRTTQSVNVAVSGNPALARLGDWPWLQRAHALSISGSPIESIAGLRALQSAETLSLEALPSLTSLTGLENLETVKDLTLRNVGVTSFGGLSKLRSSDSLSVESCTQLSSLDGSSNLSALKTLRLKGLPALANINGLSRIRSLTSLDFEQLPALTSLSGLSALESVEDVKIIGAGRLQDLHGFARVTHIPGTLHIESASALSSLDGLAALRSIGGQLRLVGNGLQSLRALANLQSMGSPFITGNMQLSSCEVNWFFEHMGLAAPTDENYVAGLFTYDILNAFNGGPLGCETPIPTSLPGFISYKQVTLPSQEIYGAAFPSNQVALVGMAFNRAAEPPGPTNPSPGAPQVFVRGVSTAGEPLWGSLLSTVPNFSYHSPLCWGADTSGAITVVADEATYWPGPKYTAIHRLAADGALLGTTRQPYYEDPKFCAVDAQGNVYLGISNNWTTNEPRLVKQDAAGTLLWQKAVDLPAEVSPPANFLIQPLSSGVLVTSPTNFELTRLMRLRDDGTVAWTRIVRGAYRFSPTEAPDGRIVVVGMASSGFPFDVGDGPIAVPRPDEGFTFLLSLRPDGSVESVRFLDGECSSPRIAFGPDGSLYFVTDALGRPYTFQPASAPGSRVDSAALVKFDPAGDFVWSRSFAPLTIPWWGGDGSAIGALDMNVTADRVVIATGRLVLQLER